MKAMYTGWASEPYLSSLNLQLIGVSLLNDFLHQVSETASFKQDLGLDSLDEVEIVMAIEEEFALEIPDAEADKIKSTRDVIEFVASHPRAK